LAKWEKRPQELVARYIRKTLYFNENDNLSEEPEDETDKRVSQGAAGDTQKAPAEEAE